MGKTYIGIDNGVTGTVSILPDRIHYLTPVKKCLSYTKKKQWLNRIDTAKLTEMLSKYACGQTLCIIERPMINPARFKASMSALRALEATLIVLDTLEIPYEYIDSKQWQKVMLPQGLKGEDELKRAAMEVARRLFPDVKIKTAKGADSLLIAEFARRAGW
jgi:hypothetical protein